MDMPPTWHPEVLEFKFVKDTPATSLTIERAKPFPRSLSGSGHPLAIEGLTDTGFRINDGGCSGIRYEVTWIRGSTPPTIELALQFVIKKNLSFVILNPTAANIMNPRYSLLLWNLDNPRNKPPSDGSISLPNTTEMMNDYVRAGSAVGPKSLGNRWEEMGLLKAGDRMFGLAAIDCPSCAKRQDYYLYAVHKQDGWYCESPNPISYII